MALIGNDAIDSHVFQERCATGFFRQHRQQAGLLALGPLVFLLVLALGKAGVGLAHELLIGRDGLVSQADSLERLQGHENLAVSVFHDGRQVGVEVGRTDDRLAALAFA